MGEKVIINIVYAPQPGPPVKIFENEKGEIWNSKKRDPSKINIGMGWYSINPNPHDRDSILVVEPYCVLQKDYTPSFLKDFRYIFTWAVKGFKPSVKGKVVEINHPTYHNIPTVIGNDWLPWDQRANEIVIIANNKSSKHHSELYSLRLQMADVLDAASTFKVSWYGQIPIKRSYYRGRIEDKQKVLGKVKFSLCTENSYDPIYTHNYFTEKMPDVWEAGAVPIYMGCFNIDDFGIFDHSYIDLRTYIEKRGKGWLIKKKPLLDRIEHYDKNRHAEYLVNLKNLYKSDKIYNAHSYERAYMKIIDTFAS